MPPKPPQADNALHVSAITLILLFAGAAAGQVQDKLPQLAGYCLSCAGAMLFCAFCSFRVAMLFSKQYIEITWTKLFFLAAGGFGIYMVADRSRLTAFLD